ncbi:MAG: autotransporter domain-containing protein [Bradyrhizobium sp.]|nr:autotransporter domain-containing protein [Bradyrhizobium sp.]
MTNVWTCPSGVAAAGRPGLRFRDAFLGTVAAGALSLAFGGPALAGPVPVPPAGCTLSGGGTIETCTGDQHAGVTALPPPVTTLNVNSLTTAITPASGTNGITFTSAGAVTINSNTGAFGITTQGNSAYGILARSYGAGAVTVTSAGNITTAGDSANGISAASFGTGAVTVTSTGNIATAGVGAGGIYALTTGTGAVMVTSTGNITTAGLFAGGIYAAGRSAVTVTSTGNIATAGGSASGIYANSRGAGAVTVTSTGNISTIGNSAYGISAHSGGTGAIAVTSTGNITTAGGNGYGIDASGAGAVTVTSTGNITTTGTQGAGIRVSQSSNDAGALTVTSTGNISTRGDDAFGIRVSQSSNDTGAVTVTSTGNITTAGNAAGGISAHGDAAVTVTSTGNISTAGTVTRGIEAISAGAGAVSVASIGNISAQGSGVIGISAVGNDAVTLTSTGNVTLLGNNSTGLQAFGQGSGAVSLTSTGNVSTTGSDSNAILGESNSGPIAITIKSGTVSGGSGTGAGVDLVRGTNNTLTNFGTVTALSGLAITGDTGNNTVNNFGTVIGNVILGTGTNAFNNMAGGLFNAGATVNLGAGNVLTNAGTLSPGGAGVIQTTALTGNLVQTATALFLTDINVAGASSDRVNVSGTANLAGAVQLQVSNLTFAPWQQTILSAAGGTTNNGLALLASPALQAQLVYPNSTDVVVKSTGLNFVVPGLNNNQTSLANALNGAAHTDGLGGPIFNLLLNGVTSLPGYNLALNQLTGEAATGSQQTTFDAMNMFMGTMLDPSNRGTTSAPGGEVSGYASEGDASAYASTRNTGAARDAYAMFTKAPLATTYDPRWSVWASGFGGSQTTDGNAAVGSNNTTSSVYGTAVGADYIFSPRTIAGFALAGGGTNFSVANSGSGHSDLFQAGAFVKHTVGPAYISAALAYGWQDITTNRTVTAAGTNQLRAQFDANAFSGRLEGGYRFVAPWVGGIGITPYAAAQFTTFDLPAYAEQAIVGSNAFALAYGARDVTDTRGELGIRTDKSWAMIDGILTLRGRVAWAHDFDPDRSIAATFQSLPGASFVVNGAAQASDSALVTASVEKKWLSGWSAAATFEGEFSDVTRSYAGKGVVRYVW